MPDFGSVFGRPQDSIGKKHLEFSGYSRKLNSVDFPHNPFVSDSNFSSPTNIIC